MSQEDVERTLRDALAARARAAVADTEFPPPPRFAAADPNVPRAGRRLHRLFAPLAAAAAVLAVVGGIVAVTQLDSGSAHRHAAAGRHSSASSASSGTTGAPKMLPIQPSPSAASAPPAASKTVHIRLFNADGRQYGVGMPVIAYFSGRIVDARPLVAATTVTVNGKPMPAAWYFMRSPTGAGAMEGHLRPRNYWPAHAKVHVAVEAAGLPTGNGLRYDDTLTLDFTTGPRTVAMVDDRRHTMTVTSDGREVRTFPVSLGARHTPTMSGVKVVMQKGKDVPMRGPGYFDPHVRYTQRLTYGGEYLHAAPWNTYNIEHGIDSSNGGTNLRPTDAAVLYKMLEVGDIVDYPNAPGPAMSVSSGFGDWNVPWSTWRTGGLVPTS